MKSSHHELPVAIEVCTWVSHEKQLLQVDVVLKAFNAAQLANEIYSQVKFCQLFTSCGEK